MNNHSHFSYPSDSEQTSYTRPESNISMASSSAAASSSQGGTISGNGSANHVPISPLTFYNNSIAIRHEIQRFESVHPSIYAIYDLLDMIGGQDLQLIAQRIRDHVVCIEGQFSFIYLLYNLHVLHLYSNFFSYFFFIGFCLF